MDLADLTVCAGIREPRTSEGVRIRSPDANRVNRMNHVTRRASRHAHPMSAATECALCCLPPAKFFIAPVEHRQGVYLADARLRWRRSETPPLRSIIVVRSPLRPMEAAVRNLSIQSARAGPECCER